ncbi:uncharacterized protein BKA78DRAFT_295593 [Phyllosticta capitalensis]|uniref:uncharacterized protein n=1 Tax=Phyllosticta capitalensis TaxID=121624 RepID=UPI0031310ADA
MDARACSRCDCAHSNIRATTQAPLGLDVELVDLPPPVFRNTPPPPPTPTSLAGTYNPAPAPSPAAAQKQCSPTPSPTPPGQMRQTRNGMASSAQTTQAVGQTNAT